MQKGKTSKFVPKLGLVLWMFPLSSWAISGTIPEANSALTSYAHEAREIDAIAQSAKKRTVTGTITDASDGTPIIGANIVVKGSQTGVISDLDGNYSIEVSSKDVLVISFIGYKTREVPVVDLGIINVKLKSDNEMLDEVVVVGAGTQKKVSVTGSITSVKGSSLVTPTSSLTNALAGKLSGVIAKTSSGAPGEAAEFYIRGIGTFGGRATPLIMLDDVEISAADLNNIPAETIESFSILKDASATAIYGARGANGVMLITTKSGRGNTRHTNKCDCRKRLQCHDQFSRLRGRCYLDDNVQRSTSNPQPRHHSEIYSGTNRKHPFGNKPLHVSQCKME